MNNTVLKTLAILELIANYPEGVNLAFIYRTLDIPKATVYSILQTLYKTDAIYYKDTKLKTYAIGSKLFSIGSVYTRNSNLLQASTPRLISFAEENHTSVFITKRIENKIVYVYKYIPNGSRILIMAEVGDVERDFENNAIGKCYSTFDSHVKQYGILKLENQTNKLYVLTEPDEYNIREIAIPLYNFENRVCGVIGALFLNVPSTLDKIIDSFAKLSKTISRQLGYTGNFKEE